MLSKLEEVRQYAHAQGKCRATMLEEAFADAVQDACGSCDVCTSDKKQWRSHLKEILSHGPIQPHDFILSHAPGHRQDVRAMLATWYRSGAIEANDHWIRWAGKEGQG
jgi:hypothetical protein